jgi:N-acetyl-gamma-glutamyl-phosphate reductase
MQRHFTQLHDMARRRWVLSYKVFIDGQEGTTGLKIHERLRRRDDIELLEISEDRRKDSVTKLEFYRHADVTILCLPDQASHEAFELARNENVRLIDASTAFRTDPGWAYGLPELCPEQRGLIRNSRYVSNCGCYAAGFILPLRPLVTAGIVQVDYPVTVHAVSGYSGGGKRLIQIHEGAPGLVLPTRPYALPLRHKHVPEMQKYAGLAYPPLFAPMVGHFYQGMAVSTPLVVRSLAKRVAPSDVREILAQYYEREQFVRVVPVGGEGELEDGYLSPTGCNGTNRLDIFVSGNDDQILVTARLDNLGKGASGNAVQCMNIMLGLEESAGLTTGS